ncbi:MAG: hypothetical protein OEY17_00765 [Nitrosopumilus sp.]|nr:hypothetical protein [Nitrosopumilus sp.]
MSKISLFDTFKMTNQLTGKAKRQRKIIEIIWTTQNFKQRTKVEIAKKISIEAKQSWKNIYSGVYDDIEKNLLPQRIIEMDGKIPVKRGPRLLQNEGTGYYRLTNTGILLLFCIGHTKVEIDFIKFTHQRDLGERLNGLYQISPSLCFLLLEKYVSVRCIKGENIVPITLEGISETTKFTLKCDVEFIKSMLSCSKDDQRKILMILSDIEHKH